MQPSKFARVSNIGSSCTRTFQGPSRPSLKLLKADGSQAERLRLQKPTTGSTRSIHTSSSDQGPALAVKPYYSPRIEQAPLPRRQALTAKETRTLDEMFASVFNAARQQEQAHGGFLQETKITSGEMAERLSTKPMEVRWTRVGDDVLDLKKEEIARCQTDHALYTWTVEELFGSLINTHSSEASTSKERSEIPAFAYPQLLAIVMRTFRTTYNDPHTALALFDYARHASPTSYVTCCGTAAYNELIETKWESFHDVQGVGEAIEEMTLNKVRIDTRTRNLVEILRREIGKRSFWQEEGFGESQSSVMSLLERIERACWPNASKPTIQNSGRSRSSSKWTFESEEWKRPISRDQDELQFV